MNLFKKIFSVSEGHIDWNCETLNKLLFSLLLSPRRL